MFRFAQAARNALRPRALATSPGSSRLSRGVQVAGAALAGTCAVAVSVKGFPVACEEAKSEGMAFRMLGNTGIQVSVLSYGFWATFGVKDDLKGQDGVEMAKACLRVARKGGVNLFDNAEVYGNPMGAAEEIMGLAMEQLQQEDPELWRRSDLVITTKLFWGGVGVNEKGLSRKHMVEGMDACLKRLRMSYVDCIFCHRPDPFTPTETVVRGMTDLVRSGKATCWGTSEWSAVQIVEAVWIARMYGLEPPQFEQPHYNMFHRERFEQEYHPIYKEPYCYGTTIWSPLASGLLTGKYNDEIPAGSRASMKSYAFIANKISDWREQGKFDIVRKLTFFAQQELQCSMSQLAIAWCLKNENVSTVLLGATKPEQLEETLLSVDVARRLTPGHLAKIEEILGNKPAQYQGYGGGGMRQLKTL